MQRVFYVREMSCDAASWSGRGSRKSMLWSFMERQGYPKEYAVELHGEGEVRRGNAERHASASGDSDPKGGDGYGRSRR